MGTDDASYKRQVLMDRRRAMVAELIVKRPGITQRQITAWLATVVEKKNEFGEVIASKPRLVNPETGEPFCLTTINKDIEHIRQLWRDLAAKDAAEWLAAQLAALDEAEAIAWIKKDTSEVLKVWQQRNKILGLEAPLKIARTKADGSDVTEPDVITVFVYDDAKQIRGQLQVQEQNGTDDSSNDDG